MLFLAAPSAGERLAMRGYTTADGLGHNDIQRIRVDSKGFVWLCTLDGLSRFDGSRFKTYSRKDGLPDPEVTDLLEARNGEYWVVTRSGLCRFNASASGPFHCEPETLPGGPSVNRTDTMVETPDGTLWVATQEGLLSRPRGGRWTRVPAIASTESWESSWIQTMLVDRSGDLWAGGTSGIYRLRRGKWQRWSHRQGVPPGDIQMMAEDNGTIWIATSKGVYRADEEEDPKIRLAYGQRDLSSTYITAVGQWRGAIWVGTDTGVAMFPGGAVTEPEPPWTSGACTFTEDPRGDLWVGTHGSGAFRMKRQGLSSYPELKRLPVRQAVAGILEDRGGNLIAVSKSIHKFFLSRLSGDHFLPVLPHYPPGTSFWDWSWGQVALQSRSGEWWIPAREGLLRFPKTDRLEDLARTPPLATYSLSGLREGVPGRLYEDRHGMILISLASLQGGALFRLDPATGKVTQFDVSKGFPGRHDDFSLVSTFAEDKEGNLWVGLHDSTLLRFRGGHFTEFKAGAPAKGVRGLLADSAGRLWVATRHEGMYRSDNPTAENPRFQAVRGLASDAFACVTEDRLGRIYFAGSRGVEQYDIRSGVLKLYTSADGLASGELRVCHTDRQGDLWFGSDQELSRLRLEPADLPRSSKMVISSIAIAGRPYAVPELGAARVTGISIPYDQRHLRLEYFGFGERLRYQFRLNGRAWSDPAPEGSVDYQDLAAGTYLFEARAVSADGGVSETPAVVEFAVIAPLWQRWWFLAASAFAIAGTALLAHRARVTRLVEMESLRTRIATDLHDDVGASLSLIALLGEMALRSPIGSANDVVRRMTESSREVLDAMGDLVWAIHPRRDSLSDLTYRMRRFASDTLGACNIELSFHSPEDGPLPRIDPEVRSEVYLVLKESVNNAARHSGATRVEVDFVLRDSHLELRVRDNGRGFGGQSPDLGNGLSNMRARATRVGGSLEILSAKGVTIVLLVPLRHARTYSNGWWRRVYGRLN